MKGIVARIIASIVVFLTGRAASPKRETPAAFQTTGVFLLYRKPAERSTIGTVII